MENTPQSLSYSRAYQFGKCRKAYSYKYIERLKRTPRDMYFDSWLRMFRGTLIHAGMEYGFLGKDVLEGVQARAAEERAAGCRADQLEVMDQLVVDSAQVALDALAWMPVSDWEPLILNGVPTVEMELTMPLPGGWERFVGYADLVARHKPTGRVMLLDYKTRERFEAPGADEYNLQFILYLKCLAELGIEVHGSVVFEIKPTLPKRSPRIVREDSGSLNETRISADGRFRTIPTFRPRRLVEAVWADFERQAVVIAESEKRPDTLYRNLNAFNCRDCPYSALCMAELNGDDVEFVLESSFGTKYGNVVLEDL